VLLRLYSGSFYRVAAGDLEGWRRRDPAPLYVWCIYSYISLYICYMHVRMLLHISIASSYYCLFFFQPAAAGDLEGWRRRDPAPLYVRVHAQFLQDQKRDRPTL